MIHILVTRQHAYTVRQYLQVWGRDVRGIVTALCYEDLAHTPRLKPGTYIFGDLERLTDAQLELSAMAWTQMRARPDDFRLLNHPAHALRRFDMLRAMHAAGINRFQVWRMSESEVPARFPLFLRRESDHEGAQSLLLHSHEELAKALDDVLAGGADRRDVMAVEYCDTADSHGIYRKYSAFRIADQIIARHLFHSAKWMLKKADLVEPDQVREELHYVQTNPHESELRRIFELAKIDYGRIDYAVLDGRVQVWEINTNPTITVPPNRTAPPRMEGQSLFARALEAAWKQTDQPSRHDEPLRWSIPRALRTQLNAGLRQRAARQIGRAVRWLARQPIFTDPRDLNT